MPNAVTIPPHMPKQCGEPKKPAASAATHNSSVDGITTLKKQ
jgi:hypothetical protein